MQKQPLVILFQLFRILLKSEKTRQKHLSILWWPMLSIRSFFLTFLANSKREKKTTYLRHQIHRQPIYELI